MIYRSLRSITIIQLLKGNLQGLLISAMATISSRFLHQSGKRVACSDKSASRLTGSIVDADARTDKATT
jgi:hypothetical protein